MIQKIMKESRTQIPDKEKVRKLLRVAFPNVSDRNDLTPLSHDDCIYMRSRLATVADVDLPFYLVQILEDLLDTHTERVGDSEYAEAVVQFLNVLVQGTDLETIKEMYGEAGVSKTLQDENFIRQERQKAVAHFTKEQAFSICNWLESAYVWQDLKWYLSDIDAALTYWRMRCEIVSN